MATVVEVQQSRADLFAELVHAMDASAWVRATAADGITVDQAHPVYRPGGAAHRVEGFLIRADLEGVTVDHGLAYFHDACHFADTANKMTSASEIIRVLASPLDAYEAIVRTGFGLPWPLQDREFLHYVAADRTTDAQGRDVAVIAYATVDDPSLPPPWPGALRCAMQPSGQRVTDLGGGRVRVEHCMTYDLGGWIGPRVQDTLFRGGHVKAYLDEWTLAMATLQREARQPPLTRSRAATGASR